MARNVLLPKFVYTPRHVRITAADEHLPFKETSGGSILTGSVAEGLWTVAELIQKLKAALEVAGASIYAVSYNQTTRLVTVTSDATGGTNDFEILATTAPVEAWAVLGFTTDRTGATTYMADVAIPSNVTLVLGKRIRRPLNEIRGIGDISQIGTGARWAIFRGERERYRFRLELEPVAGVQGVWRMFRDAGDSGQAIDFFPDSTLAGSIKVHIDPRSMTWQVETRAYRHYALEFDLVAQVPAQAGDAFRLDELLDRGPTS